MPAFFSLLLLDPKLRTARRFCAIAFYLAIVIVGSIPGARAEIGEYAPGVVLHSLAYAFLTVLWFTGSSGSMLARTLKSLLTVAMMGAVDELVQSFLPYRVADVADWAVDCTAAAVACLLLWALLPKTSS